MSLPNDTGQTAHAQEASLKAPAWLRQPNAVRRQATLLLGARIKSSWLDKSVHLTQVRFQGPLAEALGNLQKIARESKEKNLPTVRLKALLMARLDGVLRLDKYLGLGSSKAAVEILSEDHTADQEKDAELCQSILRLLKRWNLNVVGEWATRNGLASVAAQVGPAITPEGISITHIEERLVAKPAEAALSGVEFDLVARLLAERLVGEVLFEGLGPCEIVVNPVRRDHAVELMTSPTKSAGSDIVFSMVARLSAFTIPSSSDLLLKVQPIKRVWASKVPGRKFNAPSRFGCYVIAPGKPVMLGTVRQSEGPTWEFDDDYAQHLVESDGLLPANVADAVANVVPNQSGWWVGIPKLTTLFDRIGGRTVFETDEADLHDKVMSLLASCVDRTIPFRPVKPTSHGPNSVVAMLKPTDLGLMPENFDTGVAGASLFEEPEDTVESEEGSDTISSDEKRALRIARHREANVLALRRIHGEKPINLIVFGANEQERTLIEACVRQLFDAAVTPSFEVLPSNTHGLKKDLEYADRKGKERFEARVARWEAAVAQFKNDENPRHVLICASKEINGRNEDPVNYYAGLHAICKHVKANVHHVLPIGTDRRTGEPDLPNFVHRLQSALLDVFLAHSGAVLGVQTFVEKVLPSPLPRAIYGVQVVRSNARAMSNEEDVGFILFTRLVIVTGVVEVRFAYCIGNRSQTTEWMPLNTGLVWLGQQRSIRGSSTWIKENFASKTKEVFNQLISTDPHAVVLIEWSTVQGSWKGLSDSDLLRSASGEVSLEGLNLASACPGMTFVRLRATRDDTMSLRKRSSLLYEGWQYEPSNSPTGDVFEESYPTTLKSIVEIESGGARPLGRPHFLMVMGYRKTVQILRGMSCFKTTQRMKPAAKDPNGKRFSLSAVPPSKEDAALPAGMEVTVLYHPSDVVPEDIARLVMGLRLGYAHYEEWTALPAPLFFANKVRDYIIRYNSPEATLDDSDSPDGPPDGPGGGSNDFAVSETVEPADVSPSYLDDIASVVIQPAVPKASGDIVLDLSDEDIPLLAADTDAADREEDLLDEEAALDPQDPMIAKALKLAKEAPSLYLKRGIISERRIYEEILCGQGRVSVDLPWFATLDTIVPNGVWPDKRGIKSFWARQGSHGFRKQTGTAPAVGEFKNWFMNRLRIPQSLYSVDGYGFPVGQIFYRANEVFDEFRKERESETGERISDYEFDKNVNTFAPWLTARGSDESIAWVIVKLSHFPRFLRADRLIGHLTPEVLGPMSIAALQYFIDCCDVAITVDNLRKGGAKSLPPLVRKAVHLAPSLIEEGSASTQKTVSDSAIERIADVDSSPPPARPSKEVLLPNGAAISIASSTAAELEATPPVNEPMSDQLRITNSITQLLKGLVPGHEDFSKGMAAVESSLSELRLAHEKALEQERAIAQRIQEIESKKSAIKSRLAAIAKLANQIASELTPELISETVDVVSPNEPNEVFEEEYLSALEASLAEVRTRLSEVIVSNARYLAIEADQIPELQGVSSIERRRRKSPLVAEATEHFDLAQTALVASIRACHVFQVKGESSDDQSGSLVGTLLALDASVVPVVANSLEELHIAPQVDLSPPDAAKVNIDEISTDRSSQVGHAEANRPVALPVEALQIDSATDVVAEPTSGDVEVPITSAPTPLLVEPPYVEDEATDDATLDPAHLERSLTPIVRCVAGHHWGLAQVGLRAFEAAFERPPFQLHTLAWTSMVQALANVAAVPSIDASFDPAFLECILADPSDQPANVIASQLSTTIGVLGAGLLPMLFEGHGASGRWAVLTHVKARFTDHKPLLQLCEHIESIDASALVLTRETFSGAQVSMRQSLLVELERQRLRASRWQDDPTIYQNWGGSDYWEMHRAMFDERHGLVLGKALSLIGRESYDQARKHLPEVRKYRGKASAILNELRKKANRRRVVEGPGRDHLANNLEATVRFIEGFFDLLDRTNGSSSPELPSNLATYLYTLYVRMQDASAYVKHLPRNGAFDALHLDLCTEVLCSALRMMNAQDQPSSLGSEEKVLLLQLPLGHDLKPTLRASLGPGQETATLIDPISVLKEIAVISDEFDDRREEEPAVVLHDMLERAVQAHRDDGRLLPARAIEARLARGAASGATDEAGRRMRASLTSDLADARQRVTNAMSLGAVAQGQASLMLKTIEAIQRANEAREIGNPSAPLTPFPDFPHARALLSLHVISPLKKIISESRARLEAEIDKHQADVETTNPDPADRARLLEQVAKVKAFLEDGSASAIRVASNAFSLLREKKLPLLRMDERSAAKDYTDFQASLKAATTNHRVLDYLKEILCAEDAVSALPAWISKLRPDQRKEAASFIETWITLCASRNIAELENPLSALFKAMGKDGVATGLHEPGMNSRLSFFLAINTFVGSERGGSSAFLPPVLGSTARFLKGVVLKDHPSFQDFLQAVSETVRDVPTFILARANHSMAMRSQICHRNPVMLVDDDLIAYLAVNPDHRIAKMLEVTLLTFETNPYDDYNFDPVPREMFFGREDELRSLQQVKSAAILYGGRRLGKSSLLDQIQQNSRLNAGGLGSTARGEMAIYIPLDPKIDPAVFGDDHCLFAWRAIQKSLVVAKFLEAPRGELQTSEEIRSWLSDQINKNHAKAKACYLLIDEADDVMRKDLMSDALFLRSLQALRDEVRDHCAIRYVIAGLHNLTRMTTAGNSVMGKAEPIALQPFSSGQDIITGIELVTRPLAALGFVFQRGAESLPLRILAVCNFYPAFVQLYCKNLLPRLYNKRGTLAPPTAIDTSDLDTVEKDDGFLTQIQKKFELNLDLDKRYKAIALILADRYYSEANLGVPKGLLATEIRDACQAYTPEHFSQTGPGAYEALLEEMVMLTVLERYGARYQLRTPHIATMLGDHERVMHLLDELSFETASHARLPGASRPVIRREREEKLFPMPSAWVRNTTRADDGELLILVGNQMSGLQVIDKLRDDWQLGQDAIYEVKLMTSPDSARAYLARARRITADAASYRFVSVASRGWKLSQIEEYAALSSSLARQSQSPDSTQRQRLATIRLALIASTDLAWELAQSMFGENPIPQKCWRVEPVPPWNDDAVYYRFDQNQNLALRDNNEARRHLIEASCGFGVEMERLCSSSLVADAVAASAHEVRAAIAPDLPTFYSKVGIPQAITSAMLDDLEQLIHLINGEKRADDSVEATIRESSVSKALFQFAQWMGILQVAQDGRWHAPAPYIALVEAKPHLTSTKDQA